MKRIIFLALALFTSLMVNAQTLNVNMGNVRYSFPADQLGEMTYQNGERVVIGGRSFVLSELTDIVIDNSVVTDNTVAVVYNGASAQVTVSGNIAPYISATVNGAHVFLLASASLQKEVTYTVSGSSNNGSLYMDGEYEETLVLNGLTLTNPDSAAINIQNGKRTKVVLASGTSNTLSDGMTHVSDNGSDGHNAAFYINGHAKWTGEGTLTLLGKVKHAYSSDEYTQFEAGLGNVIISEAVSDGLHINQYFKMLGGTVTINASGDGIDVGKKKTNKTDNGKLMIEGGTLTVLTTGNANEALKCEADMIVSGGVVTATTTGSAVYDSGEDDISSNAAAKCDGTFTMIGGTMNLSSSGDGGKGINATGAVKISGGTLTVVTTGNVYAHGDLDSKPQGLKSDTDITLSGGTILVCASSDSGTAFKTDFNVYTNGATVMGIGGKATTPSASSTHGFKKYSNVNVTGGSTLSYDNVTFTIPSNYSNSKAKVMVSSPNM